MPELAFDIVKTVAVLSQDRTGWRKEINLVSWNNRAPKLDIREWAPGHEKMGKGVTLTTEEAAKLVAALQTALDDPPED
jgi:hypothetical protein